MPVIFYTVMLLIQLFYLTNEPITFLLSKGKTKEATTEVMKFYAYATDKQKAMELVNFLSRSIQKTTSTITV